MEFLTGKIDLYVVDGNISPSSLIQVLVYSKTATIKVDIEGEFVTTPLYYRDTDEELQLGLFIKLPNFMVPGNKDVVYYALAFQQPEQIIIDTSDISTTGSKVAGH